MDQPESTQPPPRIIPRDRIDAIDRAPELTDVPADVRGGMRELYLAALLIARDRPIVSQSDLNLAAGLLVTHRVVIDAIAGDDDRVMVRLVPGAGR